MRVRQRLGTGAVLAAVGLPALLPVMDGQAEVVSVRMVGPTQVRVTIADEDVLSGEGSMGRADELWQLGEETQAVRVYEGILNEEREGARRLRALNRIAEHRIKRGEADRVRSFLTHVMASTHEQNELAWAGHWLAWLDAAQGHPEAALERFRRIVNSASATDRAVHAWSWYQIGRIQQQYMHDADAAVTAFEVVMSRYPESLPAINRCWQPDSLDSP